MTNKDNAGRCDLHIHSNFSDSDLTVENIFRQAKEAGLRCIALTDHDTVEGVPLARKYSQVYGVELIEAFELSAQHQDVEMHILGYFNAAGAFEFSGELEQIKILRRDRLMEMAEILISLGLKIDLQELLKEIGNTVHTRLHLALYLLRRGMVSSLQEAFRKYLSPGEPAYRGHFKHSVAEAIDLIRKYQGLSFLAHPHMLPQQSWIEEFIALGVDGLETVYPSMSKVKSLIYANMAKKFKLLQSGGSDAHGSYKEFTQIGKVAIPYQWVQEMKDRLGVLKDR